MRELVNIKIRFVTDKKLVKDSVQERRNSKIILRYTEIFQSINFKIQ